MSDSEPIENEKACRERLDAPEPEILDSEMFVDPQVRAYIGRLEAEVVRANGEAKHASVAARDGKTEAQHVREKYQMVLDYLRLNERDTFDRFAVFLEAQGSGAFEPEAG